MTPADTLGPNAPPQVRGFFNEIFNAKLPTDLAKLVEPIQAAQLDAHDFTFLQGAMAIRLTDMIKERTP